MSPRHQAVCAAFLSAGAVLLLPPTLLADTPPSASSPEKPKAVIRPRVDAHGDPLPEGVRFRFGTVRFRSGEGIDSSALSPDGKLLATMGRSGIVVWELSTGRPVYRFTRRPSNVDPYNRPAVCFSPDGNFLQALVASVEVLDFGSVDWDRRVRRWDLRTGKEVSNVPLIEDPNRDNSSRHWNSCFGRDGKDLILVTGSGCLCLFDTATGKRRWLRDPGPGHAGGLETFRTSIAVSPDGRILATGRSFCEKDVLLFRTDTGAEIRRIVTPMEVCGLCFSPDGGALAVSGDNAAIVRTYDVKSGEERMAYRTEGGPVWEDHSAIAFSADGRTLFTRVEGGPVVRFDVATGKPGRPLGDGKEIYEVNDLLVSPDSRSLVGIAVAWRTSSIHRWDLTNGKAIPPDGGFTEGTHSRLSHDGRQVAVGDAAGKLELFDAQTGRSVRLVQASADKVWQLRYSPDDKLLAVAQNNALLLDPTNGRKVRSIKAYSGLRMTGRGGPAALAFSPDGRLIATSGLNLHLWEVSSGQALWAKSELFAVTFSADGKVIAGKNSYGQLQLQEAGTGGIRITAGDTNNSGGFTSAIAFSPEGSFLATAHRDGTIRLRKPDFGEVTRRLNLPPGTWCSALEVSPDGKLLLVGDCEGSICILEAATGRELLRRDGHFGGVTDVSFGPGLRTALSSSVDSTALLWDLPPLR
jgi:WD40 repeat protein